MNRIQKNFWEGKKVFLTGHTGFKGAWLSLWLQSMGADVHGLALQGPTSPSLFEVARVRTGMHHTIADIRDFDKVLEAVRASQPEVIFHLAAQSLVRRSYQVPLETYATNVMGTVHVLEAARQVRTVRAIVNVTSDKCYENREWVWGYREDEPLGGHDPYSSSKAGAEIVTSAYRRSYLEQQGVALASARAGNVIGGGDWAQDRLVPDILRAFEQLKAVQVRNPAAIRPWQHVLEPLSAYLMLAQQLVEQGQAWAEAWNFGPSEGDAQSVQSIVEHMVQVWGHTAGWRAEPGLHPHEAQHLKLDISKAKARLGWHPRWGLHDALDQVLDWHRAWLGGGDMREFCLRQIDQYQDSRYLGMTP